MKPRASRDAVEGEKDGALVIRLKAPPVDGEANEALVRVLARMAGVAPSSVKILRGAAAREKLLLFEGLAADVLRERLSR